MKMSNLNGSSIISINRNKYIVQLMYGVFRSQRGLPSTFSTTSAHRPRYSIVSL